MLWEVVKVRVALLAFRVGNIVHPFREEGTFSSPVFGAPTQFAVLLLPLFTPCVPIVASLAYRFSGLPFRFM
jgi:hypothetical protein